MMDIMKKFSLEGKTALVTGAAYGIGFAMAEGLASAGARIVFNCRKEAVRREDLCSDFIRMHPLRPVNRA